MTRTRRMTMSWRASRSMSPLRSRISNFACRPTRTSRERIACTARRGGAEDSTRDAGHVYCRLATIAGRGERADLADGALMAGPPITITKICKACGDPYASRQRLVLISAEISQTVISMAAAVVPSAESSHKQHDHATDQPRSQNGTLRCSPNSPSRNSSDHERDEPITNACDNRINHSSDPALESRG